MVVDYIVTVASPSSVPGPPTVPLHCHLLSLDSATTSVASVTSRGSHEIFKVHIQIVRVLRDPKKKYKIQTLTFNLFLLSEQKPQN